MSIQSIQLDHLYPSPRNVRKTGGASIDALAASIHAHGLLQNLTVSSAGDDTYVVEAGNRRLRALLHLAQAGHIATDWPMPCQVLAADDERSLAEASLAENVIRHAMHPADEFDAFARLVQDGLTVGEISARFGQPELFVKQRLKLAHVAPDILADYRAGNATLEQMMALALTDDQAMQARIWNGAKNAWQREPERLRNQITAQETSTESRLGKFVGLDAYETAGGSIRRDLFGEEAFMQDAELLATLAQARLERTAEKIATKEGWLWAEARTDFDYSDERAFGKIYPTYKGSKETWTAESKAAAGVIVTIGFNGQTEIKRGLVRPQDRKAAAAAAGEVEVKSGGKKINVPGELSFAAIQRLQAEATGILRPEVAGLPRTALALLAAELAGRELYDYSIDYGSAQRRWVHVTRDASGRMNGGIRVAMEQSPAGQRFEAIEADWRDRLPKKKADLRAFLLLQDFDFIAKLLAFLAARELDVVDISADAKQSVVDLAMAAQVDLAAHWKPTEEWLATLPKAVIIAMVTEAAGETAAASLANLKKDQLPHATIGLLPVGWLPKPLRGPGYTTGAATGQPAKSKPKTKAPAKKKPAPKKPAAPAKSKTKAATKKVAAKKAPAQKPAKAGAK
ncbi:ParB/RepB/Spo0J family partition protein [Rhodanobacter sp. OR92]|uniref:ParB/RepB/Spo0J family partition protein n=1 Tax=Rhodanobacter sp. OR92 TaxID=1076524 RepID=UPI000426CFE7|nr:ParB/RepB/Spo0J family partition protein [Rhodanobacter sp. OR92]